MSLRWAALSAALLLAAAPATRHSHYLFIWAEQARNPSAPDMSPRQGLGPAFIAAFDISPDVSPFGKLVAMRSTGTSALMVHHTNYALPPNDVLFANDWMADRTYTFDLRDASNPRLIAEFRNAGPYMYPHSFVYLSNGNTLATFQYTKGFNRSPGGLVELDARGRVVKASSAANPRVDPNIRPYSMAVIERLDRVVTSSADMMGAQTSRAVQIWRLSDLRLLRTLALPKPPDWYYDDAADSSEPRLLSDGTTVVVPTFRCGLFLLRNLIGAAPALVHVYDFGYRLCEVPVIAGDYLVESAQSGHSIVSLDMHDPAHPREVSRLLLQPDEYPHWLALEPDGDRLVITGYGALATRVLFATIDRATGALALEPQSISLTRSWPDGWQGAAIPHGAVFSNQ
ncbi:MAG TPA: hypothetical protein VEW74_06500 [Candidatus Nitrosotalea sp.]|nr:hypothetical protein [Candidatus Nitrosotalea sp.]